jgi:DNA segregation ATPase FtsK/SpoIIIE, S-DNA-T family
MDTIQEFDAILRSFNIKASCSNYCQAANYFYFDLKLNPNGKVKDIQKYSDEISLALKTPCKPSIKVLHQEGVVRLEFAMPRKNRLNLFDYFDNNNLPKGEINCLLGQSVDGRRVWMDLAQNPHMLIAGTTGSGKSILLHNLVANLINYNQVDLFLVDPKRIEFSDYEKKIKSIHVVYTYDEALGVITNLISVMEDRYEKIRSGQDSKSMRPMVLIIDEFADLIMQDKNDQFYNALCRLAQKCRAARIHIILATQRPSVNIINGSIKANFPARIACRTASHVDSKVILDTSGAENLLGKGDALIRDNFRYLERFQVAYTTSQEVCKYFGDSDAVS